MGRLIDREAAIEAIRDLQLDPSTTQYIYSSDAIDAVKKQVAVDAAPLDKLCECLAGNRIEIPCKCCKYYLGDAKCSAINDMTKPCPNTADEWQYVLTKWMEEQDAAD